MSPGAYLRNVTVCIYTYIHIFLFSFSKKYWIYKPFLLSSKRDTLRCKFIYLLRILKLQRFWKWLCRYLYIKNISNKPNKAQFEARLTDTKRQAGLKWCSESGHSPKKSLNNLAWFRWKLYFHEKFCMGNSQRWSQSIIADQLSLWFL